MSFWTKYTDKDWHKIGQISQWHGVLSDDIYKGKMIETEQLILFIKLEKNGLSI